MASNTKYTVSCDNGSGATYDNIEDSFAHLRSEIMEAQKNGEKYFCATIEYELNE